MDEMRLSSNEISFESNEAIEVMTHIYEFAKSPGFIQYMNDAGLDFAEMSIIMTWLFEKTKEGIKLAKEKGE